MMISLLVLAPCSAAFAQASREDVQLQIQMVKSPGYHYDRKGQQLSFQVKDKSGMPVIGAEVTFTSGNATFTDEEGRSQGATITYFTNEQGRIDFRVRRNKGAGYVALNASASFLGRTGARNFSVQVPNPPIGAGLKVATVLAIGAAAAAGAAIATSTPSKPQAPPSTTIIVGNPSVH
jgi:hypothetical protein